MPMPNYKNAGDGIDASDYNNMVDFLREKTGVSLSHIQSSTVVYSRDFLIVYNAIKNVNSQVSLPPIGNFYTGSLIRVSDYNALLDALNNSIKTINVMITGNVQNPDLLSMIKGADSSWNGSTPIKAYITINPGSVVGSRNTGAVAFVTPQLPGGSTLTVTNNGYIVGAGGNGGSPGGGAGSRVAPTNGQNGGPALQATFPVTFINNGTIGGGGGGGGGGKGGAQNGHWNASGGPGGGGAGYTPGFAGTPVTDGTSGGRVGHASDGNTTSGGAGGNPGNYYEEHGGAGGGLGQAGQGASSTSGGSPGVAVIGNSNISWANTGNIQGAVT